MNFCADLNSTEDAFENFAAWVRYVFTDETCLDLAFRNQTNHALVEDWDAIAELNWAPGLNVAYPFMSRPQFYLRCTHLGLFGTNVNAGTIFGNLIAQDLHFAGCRTVFGEYGYDYLQLRGAIESLNLRYGGKNPGIQNVVYTNGALDTHFEFGITELHPSSFNVSVINIPGKLKIIY